MLKTGKRLNSKRCYSEELKRKLVDDFESGVMTVSQLSLHYGITRKVLYTWIYKYSKYNQKNIRIVEIKDSQTNKLKELEEKVKELERAVGQKQLLIDYLERMIELANSEFGMDIKKNSNTPQSGGSKPTEKRSNTL